TLPRNGGDFCQSSPRSSTSDCRLSEEFGDKSSPDFRASAVRQGAGDPGYHEATRATVAVRVYLTFQASASSCRTESARAGRLQSHMLRKARPARLLFWRVNRYR